MKKQNLKLNSKKQPLVKRVKSYSFKEGQNLKLEKIFNVRNLLVPRFWEFKDGNFLKDDVVILRSVKFDVVEYETI